MLPQANKWKAERKRAKAPQKELIQELRDLADRWDRIAMKQVPPSYADRNLHSKYLRLDNEAAGFRNCAEELRELLNNLQSK